MWRCTMALVVIFLSVAPARSQPQQEERLFERPVSELRIPADEIGPEWTGPTGFVVDDLKDISGQPAELKEVTKALEEQLSPLGVVGAADFTYRKKSKDPGSALPAQVTVRVFVFKSAEACKAWWEKKYRFSGWEKSYAEVAGSMHEAVDSKETELMQKRATAIGNVLITSGIVFGKDEHIKILDLFVREVEREARSEIGEGN